MVIIVVVVQRLIVSVMEIVNFVESIMQKLIHCLIVNESSRRGTKYARAEYDSFCKRDSQGLW